jgi:hypothetical protein
MKNSNGTNVHTVLHGVCGKQRTTMKKIDAQSVTLLELREIFEAELAQAEKAEKGQAEAQKKAENGVRAARIAPDIQTKTFAPLSTRKRRGSRFRTGRNDCALRDRPIYS